ncbi:hypothetical protein BH09PAT2_BH09PAT2_08050 [soil metagenome]
MKLVETTIAMPELKEMSNRLFGGMVKAVVDIEKEIMVVDAAMHADEEKMLLDHGSKLDNLWGINFYPEFEGDDFVEFDSMINIRPHQKNFSRSIENPELQEKIRAIVSKLVSP